VSLDERLRELHERLFADTSDEVWGRQGFCSADQRSWPCPTIRILDEEASRAICVCHVGAQECPVHPGNVRDKEQKIEFRKAWDAGVRS
jgi:hypothetical protein